MNSFLDALDRVLKIGAIKSLPKPLIAVGVGAALLYVANTRRREIAQGVNYVQDQAGRLFQRDR